MSGSFFCTNQVPVTCQVTGTFEYKTAVVVMAGDIPFHGGDLSRPSRPLNKHCRSRALLTDLYRRHRGHAENAAQFLGV